MKGKMKKFLALALATVMLLAMGMTAFAAENNGRIEVSNTTIGEKYQVYKIFDASVGTITENGESKTIASYTATEAQKNWYEKQENNPFAFAKTSTGFYNVTTKEGVDAKAISEFFKTYYDKTSLKNGLGDNLAAETETEPKDGTGKAIEFTGLSYGYYLVTSTMGATVSIDTTTPTATVIDKNQSGPSIDEKEGKKIVSVNDVNVDVTKGEDKLNSVNYGDTVKFKLTINTTNYNEDKLITQYDITDIMPTNMEKTEDIVVKVVPTSENATESEKTLTTNKEYSITSNNNGFKVSIPWVDTSSKASLYASPAKIEIEYTAKVKDTATPNEEMKNTVSFTYKVDGEEDDKHPEVNESSTSTYTYAVAINKIDQKGEALGGAKFQIKKGDSVLLVKATDKTGVYNYVGTAQGDAATREATAEAAGGIVTSPAETGVIIVKGVSAGDYIITETEAPAGYNLLDGTKTVKALLNGEYTKTITVYKDADGNVSETETDDFREVSVDYDVLAETIINTTGAVLPSTGGIGTTIFYVVGGILVLGACVLLVTKKRMSARD